MLELLEIRDIQTMMWTLRFYILQSHQLGIVHISSQLCREEHIYVLLATIIISITLYGKISAISSGSHAHHLDRMRSDAVPAGR